MKVYVKYSNKPPYLPVAVADSKAELAKMLGVRLNNVICAFYKKTKTYQEVEIPDDEP